MKIEFDDGLLIAAGIGVAGYLLGKYPEQSFRVLKEVIPKVAEALAKAEVLTKKEEVPKEKKEEKEVI